MLGDAKWNPGVEYDTGRETWETDDCRYYLVRIRSGLIRAYERIGGRAEYLGRFATFGAARNHLGI